MWICYHILTHKCTAPELFQVPCAHGMLRFFFVLYHLPFVFVAVVVIFCYLDFVLLVTFGICTIGLISLVLFAIGILAICIFCNRYVLQLVYLGPGVFCNCCHLHFRYLARGIFCISCISANDIFCNWYRLP